MDELRFVILKQVRKTPSMATCECCHVKFFTPLERIEEPEEAEAYLREKFASHACSGDLWQRPHLRRFS